MLDIVQAIQLLCRVTPFFSELEKELLSSKGTFKERMTDFQGLVTDTWDGIRENTKMLKDEDRRKRIVQVLYNRYQVLTDIKAVLSKYNPEDLDFQAALKD